MNISINSLKRRKVFKAARPMLHNSNCTLGCLPKSWNNRCRKSCPGSRWESERCQAELVGTKPVHGTVWVIATLNIPLLMVACNNCFLLGYFTFFRLFLGRSFLLRLWTKTGVCIDITNRACALLAIKTRLLSIWTFRAGTKSAGCRWCQSWKTNILFTIPRRTFRILLTVNPGIVAQMIEFWKPLLILSCSSVDPWQNLIFC